MSTSNISILDFDDYLLEHIFSFLEIVDQVNVARALHRFDKIIEHLIRSVQFNFNAIYETFSLEIAKKVFSKYGLKITNIFMQFDAVEEMVEFYYLVPKHCPNIKKIHYNFPYYVDQEIMEMMFAASKGIEWLFCNARELMDCHSALISNLSELKYLNIEENRDISGAHLNKLKKLIDLNLGGCEGLESNHFIDICRATKLRKLNIADCHGLNDAAFQTLAETQMNLEQLVVSNSYRNGNMDVVARLKNLKHIQIQYLHKREDVETQILSCLALHKNDTMETLELHRPCSISDSDREDILKFANLKKFTLSACEQLDDAFLMKLSVWCKKLESIDISECSRLVTEQGVLELVRNLKNLKHLDLTRCGQFDETLYHSLYEIKMRDDKKPTLLTIHVFGTKMKGSISKMPEYERARNALQLNFWLH